MTRPRKLDAGEIERALAALPGWSLRDGRLYREIRFESFAAAFGFMTSMALVSEAMNHHPDWSNAYTHVEIALTTHDAGGVTELDVQWATRAGLGITASREGGKRTAKAPKNAK